MIRKIIGPRLKRSDRKTSSTYAIVYGGLCRLDKALPLILSSSVSRRLKTVSFNIDRIPLTNVVNRLESMLTTFEVLLERNPSRASIKARKAYVEKLLADVVSRGAIAVTVTLEFKGVDCDDVKSALEPLRIFNCEYKVSCTPTKTSVGRSVISPSDIIAKLTPTIADLATPSALIVGISILIGYDDRTDAPILLPLYGNEGAYHTLVVGPTGSGKTSLLASIAIQASNVLRKLRVTVLDPKGDLAAILFRLREKGLLGDNVDVRDLSRLPEHDKNEAVARVVEESIYGMNRGERMLLIVDEAWRLSTIEGVIDSAIREARSRGVAIAMASQAPSDYSELIWNNVSNVVALPSPSRSYLEELGRYIPLADSLKEFLTSSRQGRAIVWFKADNRTVPIRLRIEPLVLKHGP